MLTPKKTFLILPSIILFLSCATASIQQSVYHSIVSVEPQWERIEEEVGYFHGKISTPKIEFHALRVDLNSPKIRIAVNEGAGTVSGFVRNNNLIAGINAAPYDENNKNVGLVISERNVLSPVNPNYDALVFYRDRQILRAIIVNQATIYTTVNIENAVGGFHQILKDGVPAQRTEREGSVSSQRHPRSAAGVSRNGDVLYLLVIDGRRHGSAGATERETALLLRALGASDGLNFDGGGSSAMALRSADGNVRVVNSPGGFGRERVVAACLGFQVVGSK